MEERACMGVVPWRGRRRRRVAKDRKWEGPETHFEGMGQGSSEEEFWESRVSVTVQHLDG